jgi:hypothetical protein
MKPAEATDDGEPAIDSLRRGAGRKLELMAHALKKMALDGTLYGRPLSWEPPCGVVQQIKAIVVKAGRETPDRRVSMHHPFQADTTNDKFLISCRAQAAFTISNPQCP